MKIHEHQAKAIFEQFGIRIPRGMVAFNAEEALINCEYIGYPCVVKAQIHAGGRGKAGGVRVVKNKLEAQEAVNNLLGKRLVTYQTGPQGFLVERLLIEECLAVEQEFYLGITVDRQKEMPVIILSSEGGVEIEELAKYHPEKIHKEWINPLVGLQDFQARGLIFALGLSKELFNSAIRLFKAVYTIFQEKDTSLIELNPLVLTKDNNLVALDGKIVFDDNASFRHPEWEELKDLTNEDPHELEASKYNLNYVHLNGNIGCMVNGAGLAMATMDIVKYYGGEPANFLDVGGIASSKTVAEGFKILLSDPQVKAVLVNIFGGIVRCDRVAEGIIEAVQGVKCNVPIIVRLEGTNAKEARQILFNAPINLIIAEDFADAAQKAVKAAQEVEL